MEEFLTPEDLHASLQADALAGLMAASKQLPPKYFYDDHGSRLFEEITRLPEYYPTRAEHALLTRYADDIARDAGANVLLELGSGSSEKTRLLLDVMDGAGTLKGYVPVDVSSGALREATTALAYERPGLAIQPVVADIDRHLDLLPAPGTRLVAFLGSTIGNYPPEQRRRFLAHLSDAMNPGEVLLLGLDLVKEPARLVAAYDDPAGVTADFNRNVLQVLNRELDADFEPRKFTHLARWDPDEEWIEMRLRASEPMSVHVAALNLDVEFRRDEEIRTETSTKFRRPRIAAELENAGLRLEQWWTDTDEDYALALARR